MTAIERENASLKRMFFAVEDFLKTRLKLDISPAKSKLVNLIKEPSEFLGFKIKALKKANKIVAHSWMTDKTINNLLICVDGVCTNIIYDGQLR